MPSITLVRHGQASFGAADYDVLSELGGRQASATGRVLTKAPGTFVHGSLQRQRETARLLGEAAGWGAATVDARWDEFDSESVLLRQPTDADPTDPRGFQAWFEAATARWQSGEYDEEYPESFTAFRTRVLDAFGELTGDAVVVTSGGPIAVVTAHLLDAGVPTYRRLADVVANASVTRIVSGRRGTSLVSFNEHTHLLGDLLTYR